jgi:hypothetical protein
MFIAELSMKLNLDACTRTVSAIQEIGAAPRHGSGSKSEKQSSLMCSPDGEIIRIEYITGG